MLCAARVLTDCSNCQFTFTATGPPITPWMVSLTVYWYSLEASFDYLNSALAGMPAMTWLCVR
jgi:hypothetical protein